MMLIDEIDMLNAELTMNDTLAEVKKTEIENRLKELVNNIICSVVNCYIARAQIFVYNNRAEFYIDIVLNEDEGTDESAVALCATLEGVEVSCRDTFCFTRSDKESINKIKLLGHITALLQVGALDDCFQKELLRCTDYVKLCNDIEKMEEKLDALYEEERKQDIANAAEQLKVGAVLYYLPDVEDSVKLYSLDVAVAKIVNTTPKFIDLVDADNNPRYNKPGWKKRLGKEAVAEQVNKGWLVCATEA